MLEKNSPAMTGPPAEAVRRTGRAATDIHPGESDRAAPPCLRRLDLPQADPSTNVEVELSN